MPRYRNEFGVVVDIPEEKAVRINGLTPVDDASPTPRKRPARKSTKSEKTETSE